MNKSTIDGLVRAAKRVLQLSEKTVNAQEFTDSLGSLRAALYALECARSSESVRASSSGEAIVLPAHIFGDKERDKWQFQYEQAAGRAYVKAEYYSDKPNVAMNWKKKAEDLDAIAHCLRDYKVAHWVEAL